MWNKRYFELTTGDIAVRLVLIFHYKGIEEAEIFFSNIPENLRALEVYIALLYCYAKLDSVYKSESVKKAEAIMQTLRDLGLDRETMAYNCMLNLYYQTGKLEKIESMVLEMEEKGIGYNDYTFYIRLSAYAAVYDLQTNEEDGDNDGIGSQFCCRLVSLCYCSKWVCKSWASGQDLCNAKEM